MGNMRVDIDVHVTKNCPKIIERYRLDGGVMGKLIHVLVILFVNWVDSEKVNRE